MHANDRDQKFAVALVVVVDCKLPYLYQRRLYEFLIRGPVILLQGATTRSYMQPSTSARNLSSLQSQSSMDGF